MYQKRPDKCSFFPTVVTLVWRGGGVQGGGGVEQVTVPHPPLGKDKVLEGGEGGSQGGGEGGFGWDPRPPRVPLWSLLKAGQKFLSSNPLGAEGAEAKVWLSASNIGRGGGGGGTPPPPPVYSRSNTSLHVSLMTPPQPGFPRHRRAMGMSSGCSTRGNGFKT